MPMSMIRLNFIQPGVEPTEMARRYQAGLEMVELADSTASPWSPSRSTTGPTTAGARRRWSPPALSSGAAKNLGITISALLVPFHDPLRIAEDIAVLDLLGRAPGDRRRPRATGPRSTPPTARPGRTGAS